MSLSRKTINMIKNRASEVVELRGYDVGLVKEIDKILNNLTEEEFSIGLFDLFNIVTANKNSKIIESDVNNYFNKVKEDDFDKFIIKISSVANTISTGSLTELIIYLVVIEGILRFNNYKDIKRLLDSVLRFDSGLYLLVEGSVRDEVDLPNSQNSFSSVVKSFLGSAVEDRIVISTFILIDYVKRDNGKDRNSLFNLASILISNMLCDASRPIISEDIIDMLYTRQIQPGCDGLSVGGIDGVSDLIIAVKNGTMYISYSHNRLGNRLITIVDGVGFSGVALRSDIQVIGEIVLALGCTNTDGYLARISNSLIEQPDETDSDYVLTPINTVTSDLELRGFRLIKRKQGASVKAKDVAEKCKFVIPEGYTISLLS